MKVSFEKWLKDFEKTPCGKDALLELETIKDENWYIRNESGDELAFISFRHAVLSACYVYSNSEEFFKSFKSELDKKRELPNKIKETIKNLKDIEQFIYMSTESHCIKSVISILSKYKNFDTGKSVIAGISYKENLGAKEHNNPPRNDTPLMLILYKFIKQYSKRPVPDPWFYENNTIPETRMPHHGYTIIAKLINAVYSVSLSENTIKSRIAAFLRANPDVKVSIPSPFERFLKLAHPKQCSFKSE